MPRKIYKLYVSYDEAGAELRQHAVGYASSPVWLASFRGLEEAELPPSDGVIWVYPVFMQSGVTVTKTLPELLRSLYAKRGRVPEFVFKPVWGAEAWKTFALIEFLQKELEDGASLLLVAHGVTGREAPPEPSRYLQWLRLMLPKGTDMALAYFGAAPSAEEVLPGMRGNKVVVLPFLIGEGKHMREDMPTPELAARHGKTLKVLPPFGTLYLQAEQEYWEARKAREKESSGDEFDWPDMNNLEDAYAWYLRRFEDTRRELEQESGYGAVKEGAYAVMEQIATAFAGVELGGGIGLIQADYNDCLESEDVSRGLAARDERRDWRKLTDAELSYCYVALSFTDAEGYRFLVPAFMCCDLRRCLRNDIYVTCPEDVAEWGIMKTALLNEEQRRAMEAYVAFCRSCGEGGPEDWKLPWQWE